MHELSLCQSIYGIVERASEGRPVIGVDLAIGQLRQVVPETLVHCWRLVTEDTPLAGSRLNIDHIPVSLRCRRCLGETTLDHRVSIACGRCGSVDTTVVGGEELLVSAVEVEDEVVPPVAQAGASQDGR
ncbi:MAG: hydrogenase maturation nickel metallochaperone HypA [Dermatophilaceae bacterium]